MNCPKCGSIKVWMTHWHKNIWWCISDILCRRHFKGEHLHYKCYNCNAEWANFPDDKKDSTLEMIRNHKPETKIINHWNVKES